MSLDRSARLDRRHALELLGGLGLVALGACAADDEPSVASGSTTTSTSTRAASDLEPTAGPYPGDGTNGPNVLDDEGIVRQDIRSSFGSMSGTADGVPLRIGVRHHRLRGERPQPRPDLADAGPGVRRRPRRAPVGDRHRLGRRRLHRRPGRRRLRG